MTGMDGLEPEALKVQLEKLSHWALDGDVLVRSVKCRDWSGAIRLVDAVAQEAERRDHHPDVCVTGYRNVSFRLTTHSACGVTQRDLDLAAAIDAIADTIADA